VSFSRERERERERERRGDAILSTIFGVDCFSSAIQRESAD
jgi:hypothetical protein